MRLFLCTLGWVSSGSSGHFKEQSYYKRPHPCVINKPSTLHKAGTPALCPPPHHSQPPAGRGSGLSSPLSLLRGGHPNSTPGTGAHGRCRPAFWVQRPVPSLLTAPVPGKPSHTQVCTSAEGSFMEKGVMGDGLGHRQHLDPGRPPAHAGPDAGS